MLWLTLSLTAALCQSVNDAISKGCFSHLAAYEMGLIRLLYAIPYLLAGLAIIPRPPVDGVFWTSICIGLPLELTAFLCYMRAIKVSPLSLTIPFLAFTPVFVILTGFFILGETLNAFGLTGILLIVTGSYFLNLSKAQRNPMAPFKAVFREQGSWLMLITALIYSFTATLGKLAIRHSSPQFFAVTYFLLFSLFSGALFPLMPGAKISHLYRRPLPGILSGMILAGMIFSHTLAISMIQAAYMISVKRTSLLFGVLLGAVIFREQKIRERLTGAAVMMCGVLLIGLFG